MKMQSRKMIVIIVSLCICFSIITLGQVPDLGKISGFTIFTASGAITNTGLTLFNGNIGTNVGAFTGFPPGIIRGRIHIADSLTTMASTDAIRVYSYFDALTCNTVIGSTLGYNQFLAPGNYCTGAASTLNGLLTLDGQGNPDAQFVIKIKGAFSTGISSKVILINGASSTNVYWQVNGEFDLGDSSTFTGTLIANGAINLLDKSAFTGRMISVAGAISLYNNHVKTFGDVYFKTIGYSVTDSSNWTYNRNGSNGNDFAGTMIDENIIWHLQNAPLAVEDSIWILGNHSWMLLGDSVHAISFTINNNADFIGLIDTVNNYATLIIKSDSVPILHIAKLTSTISYSKVGNQLIRPIIYGNLIVNGTGAKTLVDDTFVNGNITIE